MTTSELIAKLERNLASLRRIPARRREAELADVREDVCLALIRQLKGGRPLQSSPEQVAFGVGPLPLN